MNPTTFTRVGVEVFNPTYDRDCRAFIYAVASNKFTLCKQGKLLKGEEKVEHRSRAAELRAYFIYLHTAIDYLVHEEVS
jgi:hypothetical protein